MPRPDEGMWEPHEINADNELRLAALTALDFCQTSLTVCVRARRGWCTVAVARRLLLLLHWVARRGRLLVHLVLMRRGVRVTAAGVYWWRHGRGWSALVRMRGSKISVARVGVLV